MKNQKKKSFKKEGSNSQLSSSQHKRSFDLSNIKDAEQDFERITLLNPENLISNSTVYQDYMKNKHKFVSLNFILDSKKYIAEFIIYNSKTDKEKTKRIVQAKARIDDGASITLLPNGDLFCFGSRFKACYGITLLIDRDFNIHELPSEQYRYNSSAIYYNRSVYCFGGNTTKGSENFLFCKRFDLGKNMWIKLSPIPEPAPWCTTVIFNGNILISSYDNVNIWHYSIDIDSFSIIPYEFKRPTKVMVNAGERLYLIGNDSEDWLIYESYIGDVFSWMLIKELKNVWNTHGSVYGCVYNKEKEVICIASFVYHDRKPPTRHYYKFNLNKKY